MSDLPTWVQWGDVLRVCGVAFLLCTLATVQRYHAQGLQVGVWTVNSLLRKQEVASWGVARIITDSP